MDAKSQMIGGKIETARLAVEEALRTAVKQPGRDGRSLARDAEVVHFLAGALRRLERARQVLIGAET